MLTSFRVVPVEDDYLHPVPHEAPYDWTETNYFGFNIPDQGINGDIYIWFHPVLKVASAGFICWRGKKDIALECDYFDYRAWMPMPSGQIDDYSLSNGLSVRMIEPLKTFEIRYSDEARGTSLDLTMSGLISPIGRADGLHFLQPMKTDGELVLHGERHRIDGYFTRDRSFSLPRSEAHSNIPPLGWLTGIFGDDFAFHLCAWDDPDLRPERTGYAVPKQGEHVRFGYVMRDGEVFEILSATKRTSVENGIAPAAYHISMTDSGGRTYALSGEVQVRMPWNTWPNLLVYLCMTRWTCDGRIGYGDTQEIMHNEFVRRFSGT